MRGQELNCDNSDIAVVDVQMTALNRPILCQASACESYWDTIST